MKAFRKIFYSSVLRFQFFILVATVAPLVAIKLLLIFFPANIGPAINLLILVFLSLAIVGGCVYVLAQYSSLDKTLRPIRRMAEVGELSARVAHDLRGPLSGIQSALEFFHRSGPKEKDFTDHLNLLELAAKRLENVSRDLLEKHKGLEEEPVYFDLHEALDELVGEYSAQSVLGDVHFRKNYARQALFLHGQRHRIERVFGNIVKNAIEAMDFKGDIFLSTEAVAGAAVISIRDSGPGMTREKIAKIVSGSFTEGKKDGHGIGLTFVKEVLKEHRGEFHIESAPGAGSLFRITLPLAKEPPPVFVLRASSDRPVLLMDDDPSVLEHWQMALREVGVESQGFLSYEEFEKEGASLKYSAAIIDCHFENSELNGVEVIARLKEAGFEHLYLCTVEYWKPSLKKQAEELGIKICPKPLPKISVNTSPLLSKEGPGEVATLPKERKDYKVVVIDDDVMIRMGWELGTGKLGIEKLHAFESLEKLMAAELDLGGIDLAFVDKNIEGSRHSGGETIEYLKKQGIKKVVLASGEDSKTLREDANFAKADFIISDKIPKSFRQFYSSF